VLMACVDSLLLLMNATFTCDDPARVEAHKTLTKGFEAAITATMISNKLRDVPEASTSAASSDFKEPPRIAQELAIQLGLLAELSTIKTLETLNAWYKDTRSQRERVISPKLRNVLFDAIKERRNSIAKQLGDCKQ
jgi:hypothetical protein